jgi:TetR/AcrR family transcriptional repressor of nem operon
MARKNNKLAILEAGSWIVHRKGFNNTGISEILDAAGVPKGSFYYYFKSKEDFGLSLIDHYSDFFIRTAARINDNSLEPPLLRLRKVFDSFLQFFEQCECGLGCPIGNLSLEMADLNDEFRKKLEEIFVIMRAAVAVAIEEAQKTGDIQSDVDCLETADFIINSWEGAILRMKAQKSVEPLRLFDRMIFGRILK